MCYYDKNHYITISIAFFSDVNECDNSPCSQQCENSLGSYRCLCNKGYSFNTDTGTCEGNVVNSENYPRSHYCLCNKGYTLSKQTQTLVKVR